MLPNMRKDDGISKITQVRFGGYDRTPGAADGTFYDTQRLSTDKSPLLGSRQAYSTRSASADFIFGTDVLMEIRNDGEIWYDGWKLAWFAIQHPNRKAVRFGTDWIILPDKVLLKTPEQLKGRVASYADLSSIQDPEKGDVWAVGGPNTRNPVLYTYIGGTTWGPGSKVMQDMEASVALDFGRASFGCQYGPYEGGQIREKISDWNVLRDNQGSTDMSAFKVGDNVKITGCSRQNKNNLRATIREIKDGALIFYENTFTPPAAYIFKVTETLPAEETDGGQSYKVWYQIAGDADPDEERQDINFVLPFDAEEGDVLVIQTWTQEEMELVWNNGASFRQITLQNVTPTGVKPSAVPTVLSFGTDEDYYHGSYLESGAVTIKKEIPDMDYIFCDSNRLWGCKGSMIYASALGDPTVFWRYDGLSDDSWAVEVFSPGKFTGAISHDGYPTFFKQNVRYKVYGDRPSSYQLSEVACYGVKAGCAESLAIVDGTLFYLSKRGIMADTGARPQCISLPLRLKRFTTGCAGRDGMHYVICLQEQEVWQTFIYDLETGLWLRDEARQYLMFVNANGVLYGLKAIPGTGVPVRFDGLADAVWEGEGHVHAEAVTNDFYLQDPNRKRVNRVQVRVEAASGASLSIYVQYDSDGSWRLVKTLTGGSKWSEYIPVALRRCDHFRLKFSGSGSWTLHSLSLDVWHGSAIN